MKSLARLIAMGLIVLSAQASAQKLKVSEVEIPLSKEATKKGMYVTTALAEDQTIRTYVSYDLKKDGLGFDVASFNNKNELVDNASEVASKASASKYNISIPAPGSVNAPGAGEKVLKLSQAAGVAGFMKIEEGRFEPVYRTYSEQYGYVITYTSVLKGYKFKDESTTKSDMKLTVYGTNADAGVNLEDNYLILDQVFDMKVGFFKKGASFAFIGKNAQWDKDSPNGSNVITTGFFDGSTFKYNNIKEHVLDYNAHMVTSSSDGDNTLVLLSTLNAPSSVEAWKKFQAKGKHYMTLMSMDKQSNINENVTFQSKSSRGNFGLFAWGKERFVLGSINAKHEGYYRFDIGSATDFQITVIKDGTVTAQETMSVDEIGSIAIGPGGKKAKYKPGDLKYKRMQALSNGDKVALAYDNKNYYAYHFDANARMKQVYVVERIPEAGAGVDIELFERSDSEVFIVYKSPVYRGFKKTYGYGLVPGIVGFDRSDEALTYARIVKINTLNNSCSDALDLEDNLIIGEDTIFKGANGELIFPAKRKKTYKMIMVD